MKKAFLPILLLAGLALSTATVPAVATETVAPATSIESVNVTADPGAVLTLDTVTVTTTPAPVTTEPATTQPATVEPAAPVAPATQPVAVPVPAEPSAPAAPATTQPVAAPVAPATPEPATTTCPADHYLFSGGECIDPTATVTAPADSYVAPAPTYTCQEDEPCWDCKTMGNKICGNPACKAANRFTIDAAGTCSTAPVGFNENDVRADGMALADKLHSGYLGSGANTQMQRREGYVYAASETIPGVIHVLAGGPLEKVAPKCGELELGDAWAGVGLYCMGSNQ